MECVPGHLSARTDCLAHLRHERLGPHSSKGSSGKRFRLRQRRCRARLFGAGTPLVAGPAPGGGRGRGGPAAGPPAAHEDRAECWWPHPGQGRRLELGLEVEAEGRLESLRGKLSKLAGRGWLRKDASRSHRRDEGRARNRHGPGGRWIDVCMKRSNEPAGDTGFPVCQCRLPVSRRTNEYCTDLLSRHLKKIGSRWRALPTDRDHRARRAPPRPAHRRHGRRQRRR